MAKTSIHFEACNVIKSELHNLRKQILDYIFPELSKNNESLCYVSDLKHREKECQELYESKVGQKMQSKTVPIREGVVVIDEKTTMEDLEILANEIKNLLGWTPLQIHIHRDEGYIKSPDNKGGSEVAKLNLHAHLIFDCQDKNTGKMCRNTKKQMSEVQDLCASILGMDRGEKSTRRHLKSLEYKIAIKEQNFKQIELQNQSLLEEIETLKKELDYYRDIFSVSEDEINRFEIKGFLGSKINKEEIKQLITSENVKTALNHDLNAKNEVLEKDIEEMKSEISFLQKIIQDLQGKIKDELTKNEQLQKQIENPSEKYLKQKLAEYPDKEKMKFDILAEKIKEEVRESWKFYEKSPLELDKLYRDYFSLIEDKNIWQLMNVHYKGGQEAFEKDIQEEIEKQRLLFEQKQQDINQEITQERKRGLRR